MMTARTMLRASMRAPVSALFRPSVPASPVAPLRTQFTQAFPLAATSALQHKQSIYGNRRVITTASAFPTSTKVLAPYARMNVAALFLVSGRRFSRFAVAYCGSIS